MECPVAIQVLIQVLIQIRDRIDLEQAVGFQDGADGFFCATGHPGGL